MFTFFPHFADLTILSPLLVCQFYRSSRHPPFSVLTSPSFPERCFAAPAYHLPILPFSAACGFAISPYVSISGPLGFNILPFWPLLYHFTIFQLCHFVAVVGYSVSHTRKFSDLFVLLYCHLANFNIAGRLEILVGLLRLAASVILAAITVLVNLGILEGKAILNTLSDLVGPRIHVVVVTRAGVIHLPRPSSVAPRPRP